MNPALGLSLGRIGIGTVAVANPDLAAKLFQLDTASNPQLPYLTRLFGTREVVLGLVTLVSRDAARRNLVMAGVVVDAADAATGYLAMRDGTVPKRTAATIIAPALGAVGAGLSALLRR